MSVTIRQKKRIREIGSIILLGAIFGLIYSSLSDGFSVLYPHVNSFIIGVLGGALISFLEFYVFVKRGRKLKFMTIVLLRTSLYVVFVSLIVFFVLVISRMNRFHMGFNEVLASDEFRHYIIEEDFNIVIVYSIVFAFIINFTMLMNRKMGRGVILGFITGKHYYPIEIERIFMFLSIRYSDQIVKKIGRLNFHKFLKDFFFDITDPILKHKGIIYEYVEDEVVVSWRPKEGVIDANCIRTFYEAKKRIKENREHYYNKYGFVPQFVAGYHIGNVVQGELGEVKSTFAFFGDVMNTTARIKEQCEILDNELTVSAHVKYRLELPKIYKFSSCGEINLKIIYQ